MNLKNYEKFTLTYLLVIVFSSLLLLFSIFLLGKNIYTYQVFNGVVIKPNYLELIVNDKELKLFRQNHIFINNKKVNFKIYEIKKNVLKRKNTLYHSLVIKYKMNNKIKENDIVEFSIFKEKIRSISIFKVIMEE